jgi:hypothetical protein
MKISDYADLISHDESSFLIAADWLEEQGRDYEAECLRQGYLFNVWLYFLGTNLNYTLHCGYGYSYGFGYLYGHGDGAGGDYGDGYNYGNGHGDGAIYGTGYGRGYGNGDDFDELFSLFFASIFQRISNS